MNVDEVKKIVLLCEDSKLSHFKFSYGENVIEFNKNNTVEAYRTESNMPVHSTDKTANDISTKIHIESVDEDFVAVRSNFVGVVLLADMLKASDEEIKVKRDAVLCIVEAMKIYNDIKSPVDGTIVEILVKDGDFVEFDQTLFKVRSNEVLQ